MNYNTFSLRHNDIIITKKIEKYTRTASGKGFRSRPLSTEEELITPEQYENYVRSIPFFNNAFGYGSSCRAQMGYTPCGYIPTRITSVSPGREVKLVASFRFDYIG